MSRSMKRNVNEAFEEGSEPATKRHKKHDRSRKNRRTSITQQSRPHIKAAEELNTTQPDSGAEKHGSETPNPAISNGLDENAPLPDDPEHGIQKAKKRKRQKPKHSAVPAVGSLMAEDEHAEEVESAGLRQHKSRTRRRKGNRERRKESRRENDETLVAEDAVYSNDEQPDSVHQERKQKKRRQRQQRKKSDANEDLAGLEEATSIPLEDRVEAPPANGTLSVQESFIELEEESLASESGVDKDMGTTGLIPLEDRIEAPRRKKRRQQNKKSEMDQWSLSTRGGGIFSDHDPILTSDDQHLILVTRSDVRVYSRSTSLLVRRLQPKLKSADEHIDSCAISVSDPSQLLIATSVGAISLWNWSEGEIIQRWRSLDDNAIHCLVAMPSELSVERIVGVRHYPGQQDSVIAMRSLERSSKYQAAGFEVLKRTGLTSKIRLFERTGVIVATTRSQLLLGYCPGFKADHSSPPAFYWREMRVPGVITTFDVRTANENRAENTPRVDIAVGTNSGEIMLYEDLLFKLIGKERKGQQVDVSARILHWHRRAPNSVKWSHDGNYLVSGGRETVLVIWQLDTNKQQFLPHLSSEITNIAVSPKGSSYGIRLGDNSVMVLSTANLDVETNVSGLAATTKSLTPFAASMHPTSSDRLLVAVPKGVSRSNQAVFALQTYDITTDRQLGRQALTRNSTTVVTTATQESSNIEPNVTHLKLSVDGRWLATVEEWCPNPLDLDGVTLAGEDDLEDFGAETCLKIWLYNEQQQQWELANRIDDPHSSGYVKVLALESSPTRNEFATAGADGKVRVWRPRARVRDGVSVRNEAGGQLYNWSQLTNISCAIKSGRPSTSAALAYSADGTVIAASWSPSTSSPRWTYLVDCEQGGICHTVPDLATRGTCNMAFVDRYLIALSDIICVYDTVSGTTLSKTQLESEFRGPDARKYLAANAMDATVAIAINSPGRKGSSRLAIIDVTNLDKKPLFQAEIPGQVHALLSSPSLQGYVLIDGHNCIHHLRRTGETAYAISRTGEVQEPQDVKRGLDRIFGQPQISAQAQPEVTGADRLLTNREERAAGKTLEDVLNFQTSAQAPPVRELFDRIVGVFAGSAVVAA